MKPDKDSKCGVCATNPFERNNYFYGKQFTVRDLVQEQSYFNDKRYLINRMVLGWGVVCGLDVYWDPDRRRIVVTPGMALDCCGHEIVICEDEVLSFDKNDEDCCLEEGQRPEGKFVLCLEYYERHSEPVDLPPAGCDEKGKTEYNRIREAFKLRLKPWDEACPKDPKPTDCPDGYKHDAKEGVSDPPKCEPPPDVHQYLCHKLKEGCPECESCDCVILATITFEAPPPTQGGGYKDPQQTGGYQDPKQGGGYKDPKQGGGYQDPQQGGDYPDPIVDPCTNRKLVYNTSLLYDLIYCYHGDLPHIVDFSWREHAYPDREMPFDVFMQMIRDGVKVYFDQDMEKATLNLHTFMISYLYRETGTGTYVRKQIPVREIHSERVGDCFIATLYARDDWIKDELDSPNSELRADTRYEEGVDVEITLRGSRIWSTSGKGLDGDYLADKLPTGNGTQGGDFVDWFRVMPADESKPKRPSYAEKF